MREDYVRMGEGRWKVLIDTIRRYPHDTIAIFGAGPEARRIRNAFPESTVDAYGIKTDVYAFEVENLIPLDMNESMCRLNKHYDIGVCAEVVEHLEKPFNHVMTELLFLCDTVVIQTPNAKSLWNRWLGAVRMSPYQYVEWRLANQEHVREYTLAELKAGHRVQEIRAMNQYYQPGIVHRLYDLVCRCLPMEYRDGFTIVYG